MKVSILGTGAYGLALALVLNENGHKVEMWTRFEDEANYLNQSRVSPNLKNIKIDQNIKISTGFRRTVKGSDLIIIAVPALAVTETTKRLKKIIKKNQHVCIASKGIEQDTCLFVYDMFKQNVDTDKVGVISGPTFAIDVARKYPIGLALASKNPETIKVIKEAFKNDHVKLRETEDVLGVEICGSIKNVMAIAAGILDGMRLPVSTRALFITEVLNDIKLLINTLGGNERTILSFAGFGDILLTCTSPKSRNYSFGKLLGSGTPKKELQNYIETTTVEGLYTLKSIQQLIQRKEVNMPIIDLISDIVYNNKPTEELLTFLIEK